MLVYALSDVQVFASQRQNVSDLPRLTHQPIKLLAHKLPNELARFRFLIRIVGRFNLFDFSPLFTQKTTRSCTEHRGNSLWKNSGAYQPSFEIMIENSYSFRKHSFSTTYWLTSDPGSDVRGICMEL